MENYPARLLVDGHRRADETKNNAKAVSIGRVKKEVKSSQMKYASV